MPEDETVGELECMTCGGKAKCLETDGGQTDG